MMFHCIFKFQAKLMAAGQPQVHPSAVLGAKRPVRDAQNAHAAVPREVLPDASTESLVILQRPIILSLGS
jgi:hypothetical protein